MFPRLLRHLPRHIPRLKASRYMGSHAYHATTCAYVYDQLNILIFHSFPYTSLCFLPWDEWEVSLINNLYRGNRRGIAVGTVELNFYD